jgi:glutamate 5-kinase
MRILIKIGSALTNEGNKFNYSLIEKKVNEISKLYKNNELILVSSGAVACGMELDKLEERPKDSLKLQLLSGEGQIKLIGNYRKLFEKKDIRVSQVLLTHHNLDTEKERKAITDILNAYLGEKIIPIINENDLINKEELESKKLFTDNDILAALIARDMKVDRALILTDVDGLYDNNPKTNGNSHLIETVLKVTPKIKRMASKGTNNLGLGGMYSKVLAAEILTKAGIETIIANGNYNIEDIMSNRVKRTLFRALRQVQVHQLAN